MIVKAKESMSSKERVLIAIRHEEPDRVPMSYSANPAIDKKFRNALGDRDDFLDAIGVDLRGVLPRYTGPALHESRPDVIVDPVWGDRTRWIEHGAGGYYDFTDHPLRDCTLEDVINWPMPDPDCFDYESLVPECRRYEKYAVFTGGAGVPAVVNNIGKLRTMENVLMDLISDDEKSMILMRKRAETWLKIMERALAVCHKYLTFVWFGEDLGTQNGPFMSLSLYREQIKPFHKLFADLAQSYNLPVLFHSCGSSAYVFDDLCEMGICGFDTLQPEARDMDIRSIKKQYGRRMFFHGGLSTTGVLSFGTPSDVEEDVRQTLEVMKPGGGYIFAPAHMIQDNTPLENVVAMYRAAHRYGAY